MNNALQLETLQEEHRKLAILTAQHIADKLQPHVGNNVATWVFDVLADRLIMASTDELAVVMQELTANMLRREDI